MIKLLSAAALLLSSSALSAQPRDHSPTTNAVADPSAVNAQVTTDPKEAGQSTYAAIGEVVRILLADPQTNWGAVNVDALREHLIDMDNVTVRARVSSKPLPNGALFHVIGDGSVIGSIQRMTLSHFAQPDFGKPWTMSVEPTATGADVTVVSANPSDAAEISGLGFFGILTMGTHHQPHHMMMARGMMHH